MIRHSLTYGTTALRHLGHLCFRLCGEAFRKIRRHPHRLSHLYWALSLQQVLVVVGEPVLVLAVMQALFRHA